MRKIIIDTDVGSDDAVALIMALKEPGVEVLAITTVAGNVPVELAARNALATVETVGRQTPPVYQGAAKPLFRDLVTAVKVHGDDGMGDLDLCHPKSTVQSGHPADVIPALAARYPGEVELVTLGPLTNVALAILKDPENMKKLKHVWSMSTAGFGPGNTTPVSEFNVYVDAESFGVLLDAGIPLTIVGYDLCTGEAALDRQEIERLKGSGRPEAVFAVDCNDRLLRYNVESRGSYEIDLPDPVCMAAALWPEVVEEHVPCICRVCTKEALTYGQVVVDEGLSLAVDHGFRPELVNARVCRGLDATRFKEKLISTLLR